MGTQWGPRPPQQPLPTFGPCLLWPNGRPSQQLLSSCGKRFGKSYYFANYSVMLFDSYGICKQQRKISVTIFKNQALQISKISRNFINFFIDTFIPQYHISSHIPASVKDAIFAVLTVLHGTLQFCLAFYPLSHPHPASCTCRLAFYP